LFTVYNVDAGVVGVSYGRLGNDLPDTASVVKLLKKSGITSVRLYDANSKVLKALANTGITVMVMLPNDNLAAAAADPSSALPVGAQERGGALPRHADPRRNRGERGV